MAARGYDYDIFINCPFDPGYHPMLDALVFAVHDCGFQACCTLKIDDSGRVRTHGGDPELAIRQVRNWLSNSPTMAETIIPGPKRIVDRYTLFREELPELCRRSRLVPDDLIFNDFTTCVSEWLKENNW